MKRPNSFAKGFGMWWKGLLLGTAVLASASISRAQNDNPNQNPLLPPGDPALLAGHVLFAFADGELLLGPSLIGKDGSLTDVDLTESDLQQGIPGVVSILSESDRVYGVGTIRGALRGQGLDAGGELAIVPGSLITLANGTVAPTQGGMAVVVRQSTLMGAKLEGLLLASIENGQNPPLEVEGVFEGRYQPTEGLSFRGSLDLLAPFEYAGGTVNATLKPGGTVVVVVERSEFKKAEFSVAGEADITVPDSDAPLKLGGTLQGKYENGLIDLDCSLELRDPFSYKKDKVTATLQSGGFLTVKIEQSDFQYARVGNVEIFIDVNVGGSSLWLGGTVSNGSYRPDSGVSFVARLEVGEDFTYQKGAVTGTLKAGSAMVTLLNRRNKDWLMVRQPGSPALKIEITEEEDDDENAEKDPGEQN